MVLEEEIAVSEVMATQPIAGQPLRLLLFAAVLGLVAALIGFGLDGIEASFGAFLGALAAGYYASGYLRSHISRAVRTEFFDRSLARQALQRLVVTAVLAFGAFMWGRGAFMSYLVTFAVCFAVLVIFEMPRASRQLKGAGQTLGRSN